METIPFENSIRTEWKTKNRKKLFLALTGLFSQLSEDEILELECRIDENDPNDYFEVPYYKNANDKEPAMILVFQGHRFFVDIVDMNNESEHLKTLTTNIGPDATFVKSRKITNAEWEKRLHGLLGMSDFFEQHNENIDDEFNDELFDFSIPCDEEGHLKRAAFKLIVKQPAINWANELESKSDLDPKYKIQWNLENINEEPDVFLAPDMIEYESKPEQKRIWAKLRERAFYNFVDSFCKYDDQWPEVTQKRFDEWFDIVNLGSVIDIADDL